MSTYDRPIVTYIRERNEFRVSARVNGGMRWSIGVCTVGGGFNPESELFMDAGVFAVGAVNDWLKSQIA